MNEQPGQDLCYEITIEGCLDSRWRAWFDGLSIRSTAGDRTVLSGPVRDQAALYGVLKKINNLGLTLVAVNRRPRT